MRTLVALRFVPTVLWFSVCISYSIFSLSYGTGFMQNGTSASHMRERRSLPLEIHPDPIYLVSHNIPKCPCNTRGY